MTRVDIAYFAGIAVGIYACLMGHAVYRIIMDMAR